MGRGQTRQSTGDSAEPHGNLVLIVGASGAGKDSLIEYARARLQGDGRFAFVRRSVTRHSSIGEQSLFMTPAEFDSAFEAGAFALVGRSHGLGYGIPEGVRGAVAAGRVVVANVSRTVLPLAAAVARQRTVVEITVRPDVLAARLAARERETKQEIATRLARTVPIDCA